jgi:hypothetical protein
VFVKWGASRSRSASVKLSVGYCKGR